MAISKLYRILQHKILKTVHQFLYVPSGKTSSPSTYIRVYGDPVLHQQCASVPQSQIKSDEIQVVIEQMLRTMGQGKLVGLAAPQIGVSLRIIMVEFTERHMLQHPAERRREKEMVTFPLQIFINPRLTVTDARAVKFYESCASVMFGKQVARSYGVEVTGFDEQGKPVKWTVTGWPARILQHEVDHLDGILNIEMNV